MVSFLPSTNLSLPPSSHSFLFVVHVLYLLRWLLPSAGWAGARDIPDDCCHRRLSVRPASSEHGCVKKYKQPCPPTPPLINFMQTFEMSPKKTIKQKVRKVCFPHLWFGSENTGFMNE